MYSNSPRIKKYVSRGSASKNKIQKIGQKILSLNQGISRISERNESSRMMESRTSHMGNSNQFQTRISPNTRQKITGTPGKRKTSGKVVVLNDSRLSNSFRKISGNALISNSVRRIRKERSSRRITRDAPNTPNSMLSNSGSIVKPSYFARSGNKENRVAPLQVSRNPFKNTISSPVEMKQENSKSGFRVLEKKVSSKNLLQSSSRNKLKTVDRVTRNVKPVISRSQKYASQSYQRANNKYKSGRLDW
jgi:hypothetical protein